jgi:predicted acylesterase/phospholipase RssA
MSGAVSGGMCLFLEQGGHTRVFDHIYGCSSGALNGSYTALGQAAEGLDNYREMSGRLLRPGALFRGQAPLALDHLFDDIIASKRPLRLGREATPQFSALVLSADSYQLQARNDYHSGPQLAELVKASCTMPLLAGGPASYKQEPLFDGGLVESIPAFPLLRIRLLIFWFCAHIVALTVSPIILGA